MLLRLDAMAARRLLAEGKETAKLVAKSRERAVVGGGDLGHALHRSPAAVMEQGNDSIARRGRRTRAEPGESTQPGVDGGVRLARGPKRNTGGKRVAPSISPRPLFVRPLRERR